MDFVISCMHDNGGFGAAPGHDAHMLYTVSAVQILVMLDAVDQLEKRGKGGKEKVAKCKIHAPMLHTRFHLLTYRSRGEPSRPKDRYVCR